MPQAEGASKVLEPTIVWLLFWALRHIQDPTRTSDLYLFLICRTVQFFRDQSYASRVTTLLAPVWLYTALTGVLLTVVTSFIAFEIWQRRSRRGDQWSTLDANQVLLHRCRTGHARIFPKKHSFSYAYLQVSIPVGLGPSKTLTAPVDTFKHSLLSVDARDYLERTCPHVGFEKRLDSYLQSQSVPRTEWSHAYLLTAPSFLGYSFNPVSFWYIYGHAGELWKMILEVNNTFDERRMYLLDYAAASSTSNSEFRQDWEKDFHVSPFNSRKGSYSLITANAFSQGQFQAPGISNTITLISSKIQPKMVATLRSDAPPLAYNHMSFSQYVYILFGWAWLGFFTSPRILKEAFVIYFRRRLKVWLRPEVTSMSIGRRSTALERFIEFHFCNVLRSTVHMSGHGFTLRYNNGLEEIKTLHSPSQASTEAQSTITVLSPEFYKRLVFYDTIYEALWYEGPGAQEKCQTLLIENIEALQSMLSEANQHEVRPYNYNLLESLRWRCFAFLKLSLGPLAYGIQTTMPRYKATKALSEFDLQIASIHEDAWLYRRNVSRLYLAERLCFGSVGVLDLLELAVRAVLIYLEPWNSSAQYRVHAWAMLKG